MTIANLFNSIQSSAFVSESQFPSIPNVVDEQFPQEERVNKVDQQPFSRRLTKCTSCTEYKVVDENLEYGTFDFSFEASTPEFLKSNYKKCSGTFMLHGDICLTVPDFSQSAYATPMPWQDKQDTNWNIELKPYGQFRSFFNNGTSGNYHNFYEMIPISSASWFYAKSSLLQFYAEDANCTETTFSLEINGKSYKEYRPFFIESCSYSRSYFYGMNY